MKKFVSVILLLGLLAGLFTGCGSKTDTAANTDSAPAAESTAVAAPATSAAPASTEPAPTEKKNVTISYILSQGWVQDAEKDVASNFEKDTGIKVDYQIIPADQYFNVLLTKLNSGECADIFGSQSGKFDIVSQLNIEERGVDLSGEEWATRMDPLVAEQLTANGKLYGMSINDYSSVWCIVYNKKIFESLGLKVPVNYTEFKDVCQKIKDSGVTPIYEAVSDGWHHVLWFPELGARYEEAEPGLSENLNTNKAQFQNSAVLEQSLTQLNEIVKLGFFGKNYLSNTVADTEKNMASGKYAMTVNGLALPASIEKSAPDVKADTFGYFLIPLADNQIMNVNPAGPSRFIYSGSKFINESKQFFSYLTKTENLQYMLDKTAVWNNLDFTGLKDKFSPEIKNFFSTYTKSGTVFQTQIKYLNPQWMDMGKDITSMFVGQKTPKDVLVSIDKRRAEQAKAAKDPSWGN